MLGSNFMITWKNEVAQPVKPMKVVAKYWPN